MNKNIAYIARAGCVGQTADTRGANTEIQSR